MHLYLNNEPVTLAEFRRYVATAWVKLSSIILEEMQRVPDDKSDAEGVA